MDADATRRFCDRSEAFVHGLERAVLDLLADGRPRGLRELTEGVVPTVAPGVEASMVAGLSVHAHVVGLARHGVLRRGVADGVRVWGRA